MTDNELSIFIIGLLEEAAAKSGFGFVVVANSQPTQQGVTTSPAVFYRHLFNYMYGWRKADYLPSATAGKVTERITQYCDTTLQISGLVQQRPHDTSIPTAKDVVQYVHMYLNMPSVLKRFHDIGLNILKVGNIRNHWFSDDMNKFEDFPNFDLVVTHNKVMEDDVDQASGTFTGDVVVP